MWRRGGLGVEGRLSTGFEPLDGGLGGGIGFGRVSLVYGEASTGKTTLALGCAAGHLRRDPAGKVFYVDADQKLSADRLSQLAGSEASCLERLMVWRPSSFSEQTAVIEGLLELLPRRPALVVVDSITGLYRSEAGDPERTFRASKELNRQLGFLTEAAKAAGAAVLIAGQVHSVLGTEPSRVEMVAGRLLRYWSEAVLRLELTQTEGVRRAVLEKPPLNLTISFTIGGSGLEEARPPW